uniref:NADH dehydrogenase subunit 4 n=1 Tax=Limassolla lingchuanensis TaxID=2704520 RepID=UPI0013E994AB|nr:NADH dehydrogenase subunit 4 [Limassolla lingchuanensis]QHR79698.1 NADH dehydrogenase subunit 4 [Limassolla lingchuanensis]
MMKLYGFMLFMTPLVFLSLNWNMFQFSLLLVLMIFMSYSKFSFFSSISYGYGVDYYSYGLIILSILIISLMIISSNLIKSTFFSLEFLFVNLVLCLSLIMIFSSLNMFIMYMMFEFSLIPLLVLIYIWGYQPERLISGLYLFMYTLFASLPFLLVLMNTYMMQMSFYFDLYFGLFGGFLNHLFLVFAFMVKLPMFMVHFWLPSAHVQAPVSGSMILAGLMLKIGGYGFIRFMFIFENSFLKYSFIWFSFAIMGCILVSLICLIQGDLKSLIAYSSVAHMSMCMIGIVSMSKWGIWGSYLMMISHGLCSSGLFCLANFSYERFSSRSFFLNKGLINLMPSMSFIWFIFCAFNMSCPPSMNFLSEVFIINSMMMYWCNSFLYFLFISFFSACFSYYLYSFIQHGVPHFLYSYMMGSVREFLLMIIHLIPLFLIILILNFLYF